MRDTSNTEQTNYAQVKVGDWLRTQMIAGLAVTANPNHDKGEPRRVVDKRKVKGQGHQLVFHDDELSEWRNGSASAYRYKLDAAGNPVPDPVYPACGHCGAEPDDPSCYAASGDRVGGWHSKRQNAAARQAETVDGQYASLMQDGVSRRVVKDADGTVRITDWTGGEGEHVTPEGWRVHVTADGIVTVLGGAPAKLPPTDAEPPRTKAVVIQPRDTSDHLTDEEADAQLENGQPEVGGERCTPCKGFGLVRKAGPNAGKRYRTHAGALAAQEKGNAVECPACQGAGTVAA